MAAKIPIGLQLFSIRDDCAEDLPGTLAAVAKMGYAGVEFAGYHKRSAAELRKMLDDLGLACCGTHIRLDTLVGDKLPATVEFNRVIGNKYLIVPGLDKKYTAARQGWLDVAGLFNEAADKVRPAGMVVGYHNHSHEFKPLDGEMPWDTLFSNTARSVAMQLDVGNAMHGGADPLHFLRKYAGRAITLHVKEFAKDPKQAVLVGEGAAPWNDIFAACETIGGTEWYIVEQESYAYPPMECVAKCLENLRKMGK